MSSDKKDIVAVLNKPLTPYIRKGNGGNFTYYKGSDVIRRLNEAFDHCWSSEKTEVEIVDDQILMLVTLSAWLDGEVITHSGYGSAKIGRRSSGGPAIDIGNSYKSAFTTALKKAAEQFGIGLGGDEEETDTSSTSFGAPNKEFKPPAVSAPAQVSKPQIPSTMKAFNRSSGMMKAPAPLNNEPVVLPRASSNGQQQAPTDEGLEPLSSVNLTILRNLSKMHKVPEEELIKVALPNSTKTKFEELLRFEAIMIAKYAQTLNTVG